MQRGTLIGNLTQTPELKSNQNGPWTKLRMAINQAAETLYVDVFFSGRDAEILCQYMEKGRQIYVEYRLVNNTYEKEGVKIKTLDLYGTQFEFLSSKGKNDNEQQEQ